MGPLSNLLGQLRQPAELWQVAVLLGCVALAGAVAWLLGRRSGGQSVWFGRFTVDGLLFPLLALGLAYGAMLVMLAQQRHVALLRVALAVLLVLAGVRLLARVLTLVYPASGAARMVERVFSWVAWLAVALWIVGLLPMVMQALDSVGIAVGRSYISLLGLAEGVLAAGAVLVITLWISAALETRVMRQTTGDPSLRRVLANVLRAGLLVIGVLVALSILGVDLTALSVLGGALGVGLGFGLQKLASNYVSGFVILFERSVRIGDMIKVDGFEGQVMDIKTRYTLIRALNGRESIVPNEKLITERIENFSLIDTRMLLTCDVSVAYGSDVDRVQRVLCEAARASDRVLTEPAPAARLVRFGADGLEFQLLFWIADPVNGQSNVRSAVNLAILHGLREAGVEIPFPQRVVEIRSRASAKAARD